MNRSLASSKPQEKLNAYRKAEATRVAAERDQEIVRNLPLVHSITERLMVHLPAHVERDDLFHSGVLGLIDAIDRFDPSKDTAFSTYAVLRIRGAIIDELRSRDWVPRGARSKAKEYQRVVSELHHRLGRMPEDQELAEELGIPLADLAEIERTVHLSNQISLETSLGDSGTIGDLVTRHGASESDPSRNMDNEDSRRLLREALASLKEQERLIIKLYYFENMLLREIANILGKTESRICQIHGRVMTLLRQRLRGMDG